VAAFNRHTSQKPLEQNGPVTDKPVKGPAQTFGEPLHEGPAPWARKKTGKRGGKNGDLRPAPHLQHEGGGIIRKGKKSVTQTCRKMGVGRHAKGQIAKPKKWRWPTSSGKGGS